MSGHTEPVVWATPETIRDLWLSAWRDRRMGRLTFPVEYWVAGPHGCDTMLDDAADRAFRARESAYLDDPALMRETFPAYVRRRTWRRAAPKVKLP